MEDPNIPAVIARILTTIGRAIMLGNLTQPEHDVLTGVSLWLLGRHEFDPKEGAALTKWGTELIVRATAAVAAETADGDGS